MKNICIVGCGFVGLIHAKNLQGRANLYFCGIPKNTAEEFNTKFKGQGVIDSYDDVLESEQIDAVILCTPPNLHKDQIISGIKAGKSVLVEKPMCISQQEVDEIEAFLETREDAFLMVDENYYYKPALIKIRELLDKEFIGNIRKVFVKKVFQQPAVNWKSSMGSLLEGGVHFIAWISGILNDEPVEVRAEFPGNEAGSPERSSILSLVYNGNINAELWYSWNTKSLTKGIFQHSYIEGDKGKIIFESNGIYVRLKSSEKNGFFLRLSDVTGYAGMTGDFLKCLDDKNKKPFSDFEKAKRDLGIIFKAYEYLSE
ncbi:MAG: Gfo/Idh/MocA family oxidoreductase [bacterium]|nr:Gfo/Idh/MocA family oxidoreductase [bacterium]